MVKGSADQAAQGELNRFIRWCGRDRRAADLTPLEIEGFCATLEGAGDDRNHRLTIVKMFLSHLHRTGLTATNLAGHAKIRRTSKMSRSQVARSFETTPIRVTVGHLREMEAQLVSLKEDRIRVAKDIRRAAADKDVSDNFPLDVAREQQGHIEARIRELESNLRRATILETGNSRARTSGKVSLGSRVILRHTQTKQEVTYLLVETNEADPGNGKLSVASPVGKAVIGLGKGDTMEVETPRGSTSYLVSKVD